MLNTKDKISFRIPVLVLADILLISVSFLITHTFVIHYADHTMDTFSDVLKSLIIYDAITVLSLICFGSYRKKILSKAPETVVSGVFFILLPDGAFSACRAPLPPGGFWPQCRRCPWGNSRKAHPGCQYRSYRPARTSSSLHTDCSRTEDLVYSPVCRRNR